jgi:predicted Zn-dependent protease
MARAVYWTKGLIKQRISIMSKYTTWKFVPVVGAVLALAITAAEPAYAARNNACATARAIFRAQMNEARFWIGVADQFAANGNETSANQASNEANFFLGQAEAALNEMSNAC